MTASKRAAPQSANAEAGGQKARLLKGGARAALLDAARTALIAGEGDAEMAAIARGAGLSTGLAYHHFGSKAGLIAAVVEDYYARYAAIANARYDGASWMEREQRRTAAVLAFQLDDPFTATLLGPLGRTPAVTAAEAACTARLIERGAANIDNGQRAGELPAGLDPMLAGAFVLGGVRQCVSAAVAREAAPDRRQLLDTVWTCIAGALGMSPPAQKNTGRREP